MLKLIGSFVGGCQFYAIAGAIVFGLGFGSAWKVKTWQEAAALAKQEAAALSAYKAEAAQGALASTGLEIKKEAIRVRTQTITRTVDRIVERPVYRDVCLDPDGLAAANSALLPAATSRALSPAK